MTKRINAFLLCLSFLVLQHSGLFLAKAADNPFQDLLDEREKSHQQQDDTQKDDISISDFTDVKREDWFYENLSYLVECGLISGKTPASFDPYGSFSYAECSAVIVRYLGLEDEAEKRQISISKRSDNLKGLWYAGYLEVLGNLGLFEDYGIFEMNGGQLLSVDTNAAASPIERYRFAQSISRSFDLNSSLKAKNVFSETGGAGREFILGSAYDEEYLELYKHKISDFEDIPANAGLDVLKAYYNGIFCGDQNGFFHPDSFLNRAEMAKVLSVIKNPDLRVRLIDDGYAEKVTQNMLHTDAFGVKTLDFDVWTSLLSQHAGRVEIYQNTTSYTPFSNTPQGYAVDVYLYEMKDAVFTLCDEWTLRSRSNDTVSSDADHVKLLFVLRNTNMSNRVEGVHSLIIKDGTIIENKPNIRDMPTYVKDTTLAYFL